MKKLPCIMFILIIFASCSEQPKSSIDEAKIIVDEILVKDQKLFENEITKSEYDKKTKPLYKKLDSLKSILNTEERQDLGVFAEKRFDELFPEGVKN